MGHQVVGTESRRALTSDPTQVTHIVCCRAESWDTAACGFDLSGGGINVEGDTCAMCVTTVEALWRARGGWVDERCPYDGTACPSDEWLFERIARETT